MATQLLKSVKRELTGVTVGFGKYRGRKLICTLQPGDLIEYQIKGTQKRYTVSMGYVFQLAQVMQNEIDYQDKVKTYKEKKKAGFKVKTPRKTTFPFHKAIFKAINQ